MLPYTRNSKPAEGRIRPPGTTNVNLRMALRLSQRDRILQIGLPAIWSIARITNLEIVAMVKKAKLVATIVFLVKTTLLFGPASVVSSWLASVWPNYSQWFNKGAIAAILAPWIWWAAVPLCREFGIHSTDTN